MIHVIYNPAAGRGRARAALAETLRFLTERSLPHELLTTEGPGHATQLARALPSGGTVLAVGGDGTVHEVVVGLLTGPPEDRTMGRQLAVLPVGSGDDFAFSLGIDRGDLGAALRRLVDPDVVRVDVGVVNGEPFANASGVGFDADVARRVRRAPAPLRGFGAYLYGVLSALGSLGSVGVTVRVDGAVVHEGPALLVSVQNGPRGGGSFMFAPAARVDDGVLDVVVAGRFGRAGAVRVLPSLLKGTHLGHPRIGMFRGAVVELEWELPQPGHADGELFGPLRSYRMEVLPGALPVVR